MWYPRMTPDTEKEPGTAVAVAISHYQRCLAISQMCLSFIHQQWQATMTVHFYSKLIRVTQQLMNFQRVMHHWKLPVWDVAFWCRIRKDTKLEHLRYIFPCIKYSKPWEMPTSLQFQWWVITVSMFSQTLASFKKLQHNVLTCTNFWYWSQRVVTAVL